ncbi:orotidine-5'-phosphate decarboxylase [Candidatus Roizmanbacteria bacterium CG_4_9_14_0_2_um_filter_39_13]|uniref:Orotidine-5'-phosphate decarboxylase n=2 Tax=Candidatus Roizmaniibacteriota TaxID=1752723 RepID=A0A2M8EW42_9BACT|nr:MAG: orotidine-5'-phosphate decarboxylase [Candidatus Roizmanbacteria bacterium CG_4_10_14_0_2_um_filter_39_12]PJC30081.1 MAG: orotidine-5'-phosphate decarboxylase [Candidatus Roizmanbacteria bacterium CG_4_9_14_0_2_um_filter_39_13]PJE61386.1 MAG: orotidine-5'-phosphate decarboxylase [Candidatus Roizmanbacteria bacterium CG10_big_fil_rev_8_21_14_0_10_39_12]
MTFTQKLDHIIDKNNSLLCVGLDSSFDKLPKAFQKKDYPQFAFNKWIIEQTHDVVCAYKPNSAFYEARGAEGIRELQMTCHYLVKYYPEIPIILDAKRGDIGSSNEGYIKYAYEYLQTDAITLHPYLGKEALQPFLDKKDKGCIILCRTSNPGSGEFQDLSICPPLEGGAQRAGDVDKLYKTVASNIVKTWNNNNNCMLVVGATYPKELAEVRKIVGDMTLLIPGIGAQGGDVEKTVMAGLNSKNAGMIINSSRGIIFAKEPRNEAKKLRDEINRYRG